MKTNTKKILIGINIIMLIFMVFVGSGCIEIEEKSLAGSYSENDKTFLTIYENGTYFYKERIGYIAGREVNMTVTGTYNQTDDMIIFSGNGVETIGYIQGKNLIIEGSKYIKQE